MIKISAKDAQVFVAGAMALWGFRALIWLPSELVFGHGVYIFASILTALALPLGVAMLAGKPQAVHWIQVYLWFNLIAGFLVIVGTFIPLGSKALKYITSVAPDMLVCIVLLWLLCSRRFQDQPITQPQN
jgi:hypothetical protein